VDTMKALETVTDLSLEDAEAAVRAALAEEGFGVLTEIDVAATLRAKLGVERPPLKILGACNPTLAHQLLELDPSVSLLLPCNVVIEPTANGRTRVAVVDPVQLLDDERLLALADEATGRLRNALAALGPADM
jgi:uncharacterized protein (DUF302 family)